MTKKKLATFIVIAIIGIFASFSLAACSIKVNVPADNNDDVGITGDDKVHAFDTFSVMVPSGWFAYNEDVSAKDGDLEKGEEESVYMEKDIYSTIEIDRYDKGTEPAEMKIYPYQSTESIPGIQINGVKCKCYEGYYENGDILQHVTYNTDKSTYDIRIAKHVNDKDTSLSVDNEEIKTILNSITDIEE